QKKDNQITLSPSLNEELIQNYLAEISNSINIEARNPVLSFEEGVLKIIIAPKTGKILKIEESAKKIQENILAKEKQISLRFEEVEPKITEEKINELHIEKLIGTGTSNFAGSPKNRIHNIKIATAKFNGMLIAPDEEFSFNQALGEVGPAQGYLPELVIKNNKTVPEYGGGVCQVSTTMFRAAVYSGLEITERKSHAYPVKYYNPQGFDATVYLPSPDLKFKNNTGNWILIQAKIKDNNLTFEFYGKDDGRKVIVKGPYQYDFQEDGSMKARLEEEVWKNGELILKKTFLSFYKSPNLYPTTNAE
ncbi:MAG: VanW family protein, partial [Minisyncoccales bacterium]